ncbi:MAG: hypothetical protein M1497_08700, partial [Nitrospirae bacterium]|nr:hypothetical protein [Nitrospirota bacterium]
NGALEVTGIGYPPIKAQNAAQARLMARRAAILDAYRNALAGAEAQGYDERTFYTGLSGFVKGMTVENEEYLGDGGIKIRARVRTGGVLVSPGTQKKKAGVTRNGPSPVPLDKWYAIIKRSVKFE